jgi:hypothetical protein
LTSAFKPLAKAKKQKENRPQKAVYVFNSPETLAIKILPNNSKAMRPSQTKGLQISCLLF